MAPYIFEGDFAHFTEHQLEFINKVISEQDIQAKKVFFEVVGQPGDNFVGHVKRLHIEGENGSMKMIVKVAASSEVARVATLTNITFRNEHIMYTEVLPKLVQLQKAAGVPEEDLLKYAKCYGSFYEPPHETLILEDLNASGHVMLNKHESLSNECVRRVLKNFALLHSLSHVLKHKHPDKHAEITDNLSAMWPNVYTKERFSAQGKMVEADVISVLDDDAHIDLFKNKIGVFVDLMPKLLNNEDKRYSVIQQGDAHTNNFMFKMTDDSIETILIDYQGSHNGNPAFDLLFMILNCTDHATRSKHYLDWIDYYHSEFEKSLSNFGLKVNFIYPRDKLDVDLKRYAKTMFYFCATLNTLIMREPEEAAKMMDAMKNMTFDKMTEALMSHPKMASTTRDRLRNRVIGMIDSYKQFGLF